MNDQACCFSLFPLVRERDRDRERQTDRDRETERPRDRERQRDRQTDRQRQTQRERLIYHLRQSLEVGCQKAKLGMCRRLTVTTHIIHVPGRVYNVAKVRELAQV